MLKTNFVPMKEALKIADERGIALGAFEFWSFEVARAVVEAAQELDVPVILQCGMLENWPAWAGMEETVQTAYMASKDAEVPVAATSGSCHYV